MNISFLAQETLVSSEETDGSSEETGKMCDYAHHEWNGLLCDFYNKRRHVWITHMVKEPRGEIQTDIYGYSVKTQWTKATNLYSAEPEGDCIETAQRVYTKVTESGR